jgi:hypothetical protein
MRRSVRASLFRSLIGDENILSASECQLYNSEEKLAAVFVLLMSNWRHCKQCPAYNFIQPKRCYKVRSSAKVSREQFWSKDGCPDHHLLTIARTEIALHLHKYQPVGFFGVPTRWIAYS